ncbi:MAG: zinc-binding alcohol dehydrogenase family protein [Planctomycetes bacterium]|nr:zinc-binding alcohol dehydrogenase family protein [Planctomycetota bacterium]MBI3833099.1 zinc-binding alcohol dehydrogenase family protein [Planctomycetota bacterium]
MRAWLLDSLNGLGALRLVNDFPIPTPTANEVLIRLSHAALNPADRFLAENLYPAKPTFPHILGRDGCGVIERVGGEVRSYRVGDGVVLLRNESGVTRPGTFAEYVAVPEDWLAPAPPKWRDAESAAGPLVYLTAHQALTQWEPLDANIASSVQKGAGATDGMSVGASKQTILITGASGGVGIASIHLANAYGFRVIALSRGASKVERLKAEGADLVLDPNDKELKAKTKEFTVGRGVDLVVDNIGGDLFDRVIDTLGFGGKISVVGMLGGPVREFNTARLLFKRVRVGGVLVSDYAPDVARKTWQSIVEALDRTDRRPIVDHVFPFDQLIAAFARLAKGPLGKVILKAT